MEKFEIMKSIFEVTQSLPSNSYGQQVKLFDLLEKINQADRIDVVFKKEAYCTHNLKHKHLTNKEGFCQLLYRKVA